MKTSAGATTIAVTVCPRCGTIKKTDKSSCCGRGGSWFRNCGGAGNTKLPHTWYEGIQACKSRTLSKKDISQQKRIDSSHGADIINYKSVITATKTFLFTSVNTPTPISESTAPINTTTYTSSQTLIENRPITSNSLMISSNHPPVSTSITSQGCEILLEMIVHINLLLCVFIF